jgi:hypothetical protein
MIEIEHTIILRINEEELEVTKEEARELYNVLGKELDIPTTPYMPTGPMPRGWDPYTPTPIVTTAY